MNTKLFKKVYPYICSSCGKFNHTLTEYCETCGLQNTMQLASKQDYKERE
jgi:hypothetical protein